MNLALAAGTFALILPAELPDKTFISTVVLSSRSRPLPVWIGSASGLVLQAAIAVAAGRLLALAPHQLVEAIVAGLFFLGAAYLLFVSEKGELDQGETATESAESPISNLRLFATAFSIVAIAEFGDLTQVLIANLAARSRDPWSVFVGAAAGFLVISGFAVIAGRTIIRVVPLEVVRKISAAALFGLGVWSAVSAA